MPAPKTPVSLLGTGAMGSALAASLLDAGHPVTVWNRTAGRTGPLEERGAVAVDDVRRAVTAGGPVVLCLFDAVSVRETLEPVAAALAGRTVINVTTTTPEEARGLSSWVQEHAGSYLDGAVMAVPAMIGTGAGEVLYSGSAAVFAEHRDLLEVWAAANYDGPDAGTASLFELAMLSGMYSLLTGFLHGAAMVSSGGVSAAAFAERAAPFLSAMTATFATTAEVVDGGDYRTPGQTLEWTDTVLETIARASREAGVDPVPVETVRGLVRGQIERGHGRQDVDRIVEGMRRA